MRTIDLIMEELFFARMAKRDLVSIRQDRQSPALKKQIDNLDMYIGMEISNLENEGIRRTLEASTAPPD